MEYAVELYKQFVYISENLSPMELWLVIAVAFLLLLVITYRSVGIGGVLGVCLIAFFVYILYDHQSFSRHEETKKNEKVHMDQIDDELQKSNIFD